jgi:hypothetical protein
LRSGSWVTSCGCGIVPWIVSYSAAERGSAHPPDGMKRGRAHLAQPQIESGCPKHDRSVAPVLVAAAGSPADCRKDLWLGHLRWRCGRR